MAIKEVIMIKIDRLHPNDWNPNVQTEETFNELVREIDEDDFDHPLQVVPCNCKVIEGPHYKIIGGEHRWKGATVLEYKELPCCVHDTWDEDKQRIKTVRRNMLTGHTDAKKFTRMVKELTDKGFELEELPQILGFDTRQLFDKYYIREKSTAELTALDSIAEEAKRDKHAVDSITDIISSVFASAGDTIDQDYIFFTFKGAAITVVLCDKELQALVKKVHERLKTSGETMPEVMKLAIIDVLEKAPLTSTSE